jgi:hypothetical protein
MAPAAMAAIPWKALVTGGLVAVYAYGVYRDRRREAALQRRAAEMGFELVEAPSARDREDLGPFAVLRLGDAPEVRNLMRGERGGYEVTVFDLGARRRPGDGGSPVWRTAVRVASPSLRLPAFVLDLQSRAGDPLRRPDSRLDRPSLLDDVRTALATVDLDGDPGFAKHYRLRGIHQEAIRGAFGAPARAVLERSRGWNAESLGDRVLFDRQAYRLDASHLEAVLDELVGLTRLLSHAGGTG